MKHAFTTACAAALVLGIAFAPALAKEKKRGDDQREGRNIEKAEERIDELESKLLDPELTERRRERIEETIEAISEKYNLTPPPDPEPVELFKDDFNRPNDPSVGHGWQETENAPNFVRLQDDKAWIGADSAAVNSVALDPAVDYDTMTLNYSLVAGTASEDGSVLTVSWSGDGETYTPVATHDLANEPDDPNNPQQFSQEIGLDGTDPASFAWKFETSGSFGEATIDDVSVTAQPAPVTTEFQGF